MLEVRKSKDRLTDDDFSLHSFERFYSTDIKLNVFGDSVRNNSLTFTDYPLITNAYNAIVLVFLIKNKFNHSFIH